MGTATNVPVSAEQVAEDSARHVAAPEWHTLRLFGQGRHPAFFDAGIERQDEL